jgi:hypothetical protein
MEHYTRPELDDFLNSGGFCILHEPHFVLAIVLLVRDFRNAAGFREVLIVVRNDKDQLGVSTSSPSE